MGENKFIDYLKKASYTIVLRTEIFFYQLGLKVGSNPKLTIILTWGVVLVSSVGFLRFHQEKNPMKLWVPPNTDFVSNTDWLMKKFQSGYRVQVVLITSDDVLTPEVFQYIFNVDQNVKNARTSSGLTFNNVCFNIPKVDKSLLKLYQVGYKNNAAETNEKDPSAVMNAALYCSFVESMQQGCLTESILDLFDFDEMKIGNLTKNQIVESINNYDENTLLGRLRRYENLLGGIERNASGQIISAKSMQNFWMVNVNFSAIDMDEAGNAAGTADWASIEALEWEMEFSEIAKNASIQTKNMTLYYTAARSFGDLSNKAMFQDMGKLSIGIFIMVIYVQFVISKCNCLEARVSLGSLGLLTVCMAFVVGCGLCSLIGISYGPVHTSLPFLLMGLGVDDMFVIMACWEDLSDTQKTRSLPERIGFMLKHAGVSISVTSMTDVFAFIVGSSTILPSLQSYCIYAAICVFMTFIFSVTFFTACFALDQKRLEENKNGIVICYQHKKNYQSNQCSQLNLSNRFFHELYSKIIFTTAGKISVISIVMISLGFSIESAWKLEQKFDPAWLVPKGSHFDQFLHMRTMYYPSDGFEAGIYLGALNYSHEIQNIRRIVDQLEFYDGTIINGIISWVEPFRNYVRNNFLVDVYVEALSDEHFNLYLTMFLFSPKYARYQANFRFDGNLECGVPAPKIIMSSIDFRFNRFHGPEQHVPAMHDVEKIARNANFSTGEKFAMAWSKAFASWITDELIQTEVMRNLQLALLCVMACTILMIADVQTCFWIFVCVLLTMVNVMGFMQRWGLSIDLVSCIGLELAIGLCVDYATHVGHTFLTINQGTRTVRALKTVQTIGSAVVYGGFSTVIGVFMLSQSEAYIFQAFFKIFLLVVSIGLFHGIVFLPVILTWIGPKPYEKHDIVAQTDNELI